MIYDRTYLASKFQRPFENIPSESEIRNLIDTSTKKDEIDSAFKDLRLILANDMRRDDKVIFLFGNGASFLNFSKKYTLAPLLVKN